jgi:hypothetical protein
LGKSAQTYFAALQNKSRFPEGRILRSYVTIAQIGDVSGREPRRRMRPTDITGTCPFRKDSNGIGQRTGFITFYSHTISVTCNLRSIKLFRRNSPEFARCLPRCLRHWNLERSRRPLGQVEAAKYKAITDRDSSPFYMLGQEPKAKSEEPAALVTFVAAAQFVVAST